MFSWMAEQCIVVLYYTFNDIRHTKERSNKRTPLQSSKQFKLWQKAIVMATNSCQTGNSRARAWRAIRSPRFVLRLNGLRTKCLAASTH